MKNGLKWGYMVITVTDSAGIKCQAGEFSLLIDSPPKRKGNLILKTTTKLPIDTFESDNLVLGAGEYEIEGVRVRGIELPEEELDIRVSTLPTSYGESVVMRLLMSSAVGIGFEELGKHVKKPLEARGHTLCAFMD